VPSTLTGVAASATQSTSPTASAPADGDSLAASSIQTPIQTILNHIAKIWTAVFVGAAPNGAGITGTGTGTGAGVVGNAGSGGIAIQANGAVSVTATGGSAVVANGVAVGSGIDASGGTSGPGGRFYGNSNRGSINLVALTATPTGLLDGDMWVENVAGTWHLKVRMNGITSTIV
jgi:hypothetical protein